MGIEVIVPSEGYSEGITIGYSSRGEVKCKYNTKFQ